jgi:hypothetical protein
MSIERWLKGLAGWAYSEMGYRWRLWYLVRALVATCYVTVDAIEPVALVAL